MALLCHNALVVYFSPMPPARASNERVQQKGRTRRALLAAAVELILRDGMILDSIVAYLTRSVEGKPPVIVANLMMLMQMAIDVFIPSTSGKAAVTMPILGPIGQLAGVSGQVCVQAFLFGNGLMNTLTPTSGMLLAYLATGKISFGRWIRFILPLAAGLFALCVVSLTMAVVIGL